MFQNSHSLHDCLIGARPPSKIGSVFKPFYTDGGNKVFHPQHFLRKRIINQSGIGKSQELAIAVFGAQPEDVLFPNQRFTAREDVHISSKLFALADNVAEFLVCQVQLVAVFSSPAASTVKITGRGRIHKNRPRNIAVQLLTIVFLLGPAD